MPRNSATDTSCNSALTESRILARFPQGDETKGTRLPKDPFTGPQLESDCRTQPFHDSESFLLDVAANCYWAT